MKLRFSVAAVLLLSVLTVCSGLAYAEELKGSWDALSSGYAITRWPWNGGEVLIGGDANVRAGTTQYPTVTQVKFRWIRPDGSYWDVGPKDLTLSGDTWDGLPIYDAYDTQTLNVLGDWGVQALFLGPNGKLMHTTDIVKIRAISFHAVPEVPFGTIATLLAMILALGGFALKGKGFVHKK